MWTRNPRYRRPFIWQDEMAEVRNLFKRVAKVKQGGFTGFSLWKDEPTAETLSRNRLRKRRCQYAVELTHLNYAESPFETQNHLNNIRGMCARIQRQDRFVERKKKDYDLDLHPALLRRPVSVSYSWSKDPNEKLFFRSSRPGSAPGGPLGDIPLHYTPSKHTVLYDATRRCPRYREVTQRRSSTVSQKSSRSSASSLRAMAMANQYNYDWDANSKGSASTPAVPSSSMPSPVSSMIYYNPTLKSSSKHNHQSSHGRPQLDDHVSRKEVKVRNGEYPDSSYAGYASDVERNSRTDISSKPSTLSPSDVDATCAPTFSSSRPSSMERRLERPPSRMMSKRPTTSPDMDVKSSQERSHRMSDGNPGCNNNDFDPNSKESTSRNNRSNHHNAACSSSNIYSTSPSNIYFSSWPGKSKGAAAGALDTFSNQISKPPRTVNDGTTGQASSSAPRPGEGPSHATAKHKHSSNGLPGDGSGGLWALRQEHHRPSSARASTSQAGSRLPYSRENENGSGNVRPSTSPGRPRTHVHVREEEAQAQAQAQAQRTKLSNDPLANRIFTKKDEQEVKALQREFHQELHKVTNLEYERTTSGAVLSSFKIEQESSCTRQGPPAPAAAPQSHHQQSESSPAGGNTGLDQPTPSGNKQVGPVDMTGGSGSDNHESHVMIKHSTDPYVDFKTSMLRMIHEENLYDKHWELEELFQYYIDLNPVVHHEVLKTVISDIRKDIAAQRAKSL